MDVERLAQCMLEVKQCGHRASGAHDEMMFRLKSDGRIPEDKKCLLLTLLAQAFPAYGQFNQDAFCNLENELFKCDKFKVAYTIASLSKDLP